MVHPVRVGHFPEGKPPKAVRQASGAVHVSPRRYRCRERRLDRRTRGTGVMGAYPHLSEVVPAARHAG